MIKKSKRETICKVAIVFCCTLILINFIYQIYLIRIEDNIATTIVYSVMNISVSLNILMVLYLLIRYIKKPHEIHKLIQELKSY